MMHGDASLWESFPRALERRTGTRRYVGAFRAPFQDLRLAPSQEHALRVCSLLAIPPPPPDQKALPRGVPEDLSEDNLSTWADTVQDVAVGMIVPQPGTDQIIFPHLVELLTLLESVSWVAFCCQCYLPGSACRCLESSSTASTASTMGLLWSDIADPTFGPNSARLGEALDRRFHMDLHPWQAAPFGICLLWISQDSLGHLLLCANHAPCWESFSSGKPAHGHPVRTDCTARTFETSSADLDAPCHTEPSTGSAASASA